MSIWMMDYDRQLLVLDRPSHLVNSVFILPWDPMVYFWCDCIVVRSSSLTWQTCLVQKPAVVWQLDGVQKIQLLMIVLCWLLKHHSGSMWLTMASMIPGDIGMAICIHLGWYGFTMHCLSSILHICYITVQFHPMSMLWEVWLNTGRHCGIAQIASNCCVL